ncbi:hypothetical protein NBRC116589_17940 [Ruegeria sp. HU-ET01832]
MLDEGSEAKMVRFCRWWQKYVSLHKDYGTSLISDSIDAQKPNKWGNHVIQFRPKRQAFLTQYR